MKHEMELIQYKMQCEDTIMELVARCMEALDCLAAAQYDLVQGHMNGTTGVYITNCIEGTRKSLAKIKIENGKLALDNA